MGSCTAHVRFWGYSGYFRLQSDTQAPSGRELPTHVRALGYRAGAQFAAAATNGLLRCYVWQAFIRGACGGGFRLCVQNGGEALPQYARRGEMRWEARSTDAPQAADW